MKHDNQELITTVLFEIVPEYIPQKTEHIIVSAVNDRIPRFLNDFPRHIPLLTLQ